MNRTKNAGTEHPSPLLTYEKSLSLKAKVDNFIDRQIDLWNENVPYAKHLEEDKLNPEWYERHTIEHVWRIRLMRTSQVHALHAIAKLSPEAAQLYARYQDEEMLHDTLFAQDLEKMGVSKSKILATEPLFPTRLLIGFMYFIAQHENPIGAICYSYLVEYTTIKLTGRQLNAMKVSLGEENIEGQLMHMNTDLVEDHSGDMWRLLNSLIFKEDDERIIFQYLGEFQELLGMYFKMLHETTVLKRSKSA